MHYSLIRESKVVVEYDGRAFTFDALANYNADTAYGEYKSLRKTIHRHTNYSDSKIVEKSTTSISLSVNLTSNFLESMFFEWLGFDRPSQRTRFILPGQPKSIEPIFVNVYIINPNNRCTLFERCFVTTVDFSCSKSVTVLQIGMEAANFESVTSYPNAFSLNQGDVLPVSPVSVMSNSRELPGLIDVSISCQQQCVWRYERSIHDINTIYTNKHAYVSEMNMSASMNFYLVHNNTKDATQSLEPVSLVPLTIETRYLTVDFPSTRVTKRLTHGDVYTVAWDVIPLDAAEYPTITFNGEVK